MPLASRKSSSRALALAVAVLAVASSRGLQGQDRGIDILARQATGDPAFNAGRQYAVVIGIDKYEEWPQLKGAVREAKAFKSALASRYAIDRFYELYDEDATAAGMRRLFIETLPRELGPRDSLLVFYAGRGRRDAAGAGSWIAADGSKDSLSQGGWMQNSQMRSMISRLAAKRILIVADACFAADPLDSGDQGADGPSPAASLGLAARLALTSGADETPMDGSEFGRQLVAVLGRDEAGVLDAATLAGELRLGSSKVQPSLGALPGNEKGASFALFLNSAAAEALPSAAKADSAPARLSFPSFGVALSLTGPGSELGADTAAAREDRVVWKVSSLSPVHLAFASPYAERLDLPSVEGPFSEGEERDLQVPSGRIDLPWLPAGSKVGIGGEKARLELANQAQTGFLSPELPGGDLRPLGRGPRRVPRQGDGHRRGRGRARGLPVILDRGPGRGKGGRRERPRHETGADQRRMGEPGDGHPRSGRGGDRLPARGLDRSGLPFRGDLLRNVRSGALHVRLRDTISRLRRDRRRRTGRLALSPPPRTEPKSARALDERARRRDRGPATMKGPC